MAQTWRRIYERGKVRPTSFPALPVSSKGTWYNHILCELWIVHEIVMYFKLAVLKVNDRHDEGLALWAQSMASSEVLQTRSEY